MRRFLIGIACSVAFLTSGCGGPPDEQSSPDVNAGGERAAAAAQDFFTVRPGPVDNAKLSALAGTFQMLKVSAANGIPSDGRGGACLVFLASELGFTKMAEKVCQSNGDCSVAPPPGATGQEKGSYAPNPNNPSHRENRYGYCDQTSNKCWSRPIGLPADAALCNRPMQMSPAVLNPVPVRPADASVHGIKAGMKVRVVACLNKGSPPYPPPGPGCAQIDSNDRIEEFGPERTILP